MGTTNYSIRKLSPSDNCKKFRSGDQAFAPLKTFLQKQACNFQESMIGISYVCIERNDNNEETGKVLAYMTLTSSEIDLGDAYAVDDCPKANRYATLPALKITRLAVDANQRGSGLGSVLVDMAIAIALDEIAPAIGCRFLIADVKTEAVDFYYKNGFNFLDTPENHATEHPAMFIDLKILEAF